MKTHLCLAAVLAATGLLLGSISALAHCDTLDGPVVLDAKLALQRGDVKPVLKWVTASGEKEVRDAFAATMKVRALGEDARALADKQFYETLVRVHRAGEGEPFTGLKPAGTIDPAFRAADEALESGAIGELERELATAVTQGIEKRFAEVLENKKHAESVESGRAYVVAYVEYVHFIERLHSMATAEAGGHHHLHDAGSDGK